MTLEEIALLQTAQGLARTELGAGPVPQEKVWDTTHKYYLWLLSTEGSKDWPAPQADLSASLANLSGSLLKRLAEKAVGASGVIPLPIPPILSGK